MIRRLAGVGGKRITDSDHVGPYSRLLPSVIYGLSWDDWLGRRDIQSNRFKDSKEEEWPWFWRDSGTTT